MKLTASQVRGALLIASLCLPALGQHLQLAEKHAAAAAAAVAAHQPERAIAEYRAALDVEPEYSDALLALGQLQLSLGQAKDALRSFIRLSELEPARGQPHFFIGLVYASQGAYERAEFEMRLALEREPDPVTRFNLALAQARQGKWDAARQTLTPLLAQMPDNVAAHRLLATVDVERHDAAGALREFESAARLRPREARSYLDLGNFLAGAAEYDAARAALEKAIALSPDDPRAAQLALAHADHALGRDQDALPLLDAVLARTSPGDAAELDALALRGLSHEQLQQYPEAERDYRALVAAAPNDVRGHQLLGARLVDAHQLPAAIAELRTAVRLDPKFAAAHFQLGRALFAAQQLPEAESEARSAVQLEPADSRAHYLLARILDREGRHPEAAAEFASVEKLKANAARP